MFRKLILAAVVAVLAMGSAAAVELKIGVVDLQAVMTRSKAGQKARTDMKAFFDNKQAELKKEESALEALQKDMEKNKLTMSKAQREKKEGEFKDKLKNYRAKVNESNKALQRKEQEFQRKALLEINTIVKKLSEERGITLVLERAQGGIMAADSSFDITNEVIKQFDAKFAAK